jgi:hypothetical protein
METLVKIIEEKMLLVEELHNEIETMQNLFDKEKESKLFWFKKFTELEETLKPKNDE